MSSVRSRLRWGRSAELQARFEALDRSQAVIEFDLDGTVLDANANFLSVMGYTLDEVRGKHHRMFVEPAEQNSEEYRRFWETLRAGDFHADQFKRIAKGGREVWIEATYNVILGRDGQPWKVVKYATDVTSRQMRLADLESQATAIRTSQAVIEFGLDGVIVDATFTCAHEPAGFDLAFPGLSALGPSHRHVARTIGTSTADTLLTADTPHVAFVTRTGEPRPPEAASSSRRWLVVLGLVVAAVGAALVRRARRRPGDGLG